MSVRSQASATAPTLLDLVEALCEETEDDGEVVTAVLDLLQSRRVRVGASPGLRPPPRPPRDQPRAAPSA